MARLRSGAEGFETDISWCLPVLAVGFGLRQFGLILSCGDCDPVARITGYDPLRQRLCHELLRHYPMEEPMGLLPKMNPGEVLGRADKVLGNADKTLTRVDGTLETVSGTLSSVDDKLTTVDTTLTSVDGTLVEVKSTLAETSETLTQVKTLLSELEGELALLKQLPALAAKLDEVHAAVTK
jgi:hypothetical protein